MVAFGWSMGGELPGETRTALLETPAGQVEQDLAPLAKHAPKKFSEKLKGLVQLIGAFCRLLRSSIKVSCPIVEAVPWS